jgi:hypothetical protein
MQSRCQFGFTHKESLEMAFFTRFEHRKIFWIDFRLGKCCLACKQIVSLVSADKSKVLAKENGWASFNEEGLPIRCAVREPE